MGFDTHKGFKRGNLFAKVFTIKKQRVFALQIPIKKTSHFFNRFLLGKYPLATAVIPCHSWPFLSFLSICCKCLDLNVTSVLSKQVCNVLKIEFYIILCRIFRTFRISIFSIAWIRCLVTVISLQVASILSKQACSLLKIEFYIVNIAWTCYSLCY